MRDRPIATLVATGFPDDATWRELKNFCRFLEGFEMGHVVQNSRTNRLSLFVKFENADCADIARSSLDGMPFEEDSEEPALLKAEIAHRELEVQAPRRKGRGGEQHGGEGRGDDAGGGGGKKRDPPWARDRDDEADDRPTRRRRRRRDTSRYEDAEDEAFDDDPLDVRRHQRSRSPVQRDRQWAAGGRPGRSPPRSSRPQRRRSPLPPPPPVDGGGRGGRGRGGGRKPDFSDAPRDVEDTVIIYLKEINRDRLQDDLEASPGFMGIKFNEKIRACFVKYEDKGFAQDAIAMVGEQGIEGYFAKRTLILGQ